MTDPRVDALCGIIYEKIWSWVSEKTKDELRAGAIHILAQLDEVDRQHGIRRYHPVDEAEDGW